MTKAKGHGHGPQHGKSPAKPRSLWLRVLTTAYRGLGMGVLASLALALLLASGAAYFVLNLAFTPEKLTPKVTASLQTILNRKVTIGSTRILPWEGIRVSDLRVAEREGFPGDDFLTCQLVVVRYDWAGLLEGRLELSEISLYGPTIQVLRRPEGEWNIGDLGRRSGQLAPQFRQVAIHDGEINVDDELKQRRAELRGLDLGLSGDIWTQSLPFKLGFRFKASSREKQAEGRYDGAGEVKGLGQGLKDAYLEVKSSRLQLPGLDLKAEGSVRRFETPLVDLNWKIAALDPARLAPLVKLSPKLRLGQLSGELHGSLVGYRRFDIRALRLLAGGVDLKLGGYLDLGAEPPVLRLKVATNRFAMEEASRLWTGLEPYGLKGRSEWKLDLSGDAKDVSLDRVVLGMSRFAGRTPNINATADQLDLTMVSNLKNATLRVEGGGLEGREQKVTALKGQADLDGEDLRIKEVDGLWNGVHFHARSRIQRPLAPKLVTVDGDLAPIGLDPLVASIQALTRKRGAPAKAAEAAKQLDWLRIFRKSLPRQFPDLQGDLRLARIDHPNVTGQNVRLSWDLKGVTQGMNHLSGTVVLDLHDGRVHDYPTLQQHPFLRYVFLPFETMEKMTQMGYMSAQLRKDLPYAQIHGVYRFDKGSMKISKFFIKGADVTATAEGEVDWVNEKMSLHVVTRVNHPGMGAPETLSDEQGRPSLAFFVEGPMLKPAARLDLTKVKTGAIEAFMDAGAKEGEAEAERVKRQLW